MFTFFRGRTRGGNALWMSATAVAFVGMYRAACTVLVDASGNFVNDLLNSWVGRIGEWLILAGVMTAYAVHLRRQACHKCARDMHGAFPGGRLRPRYRARPTRSPSTPTRAARRLRRVPRPQLTLRPRGAI